MSTPKKLTFGQILGYIERAKSRVYLRLSYLSIEIVDVLEELNQRMEVSICVVIQNVHEMQNIGDQVPLLERLHRSAINTLIAEEYFVSLIAADDLVLLFDLNETFWGNNHFLQAISIDLPSDQNLLKVFNPKTGFKVSEAYISYLKRIEHLPEVPIEMTVSSNDVWNG